MLSLASNISATQVVESKYSGVFDGTDDFIDCGPSTDVVANGASEVSVMFWVKTTQVTSDDYFFSIKKGPGSSAFSARISSNKIEAVIHKGSGGHSFPKSTTNINDGNWHHVAITGKASSQKIYVDGSLEDTETHGFDMNTTTDLFTIGQHDGSRFIDMSVFELAVFNTELDLANIQAAYNGGSPLNLIFDQGNYNSSSNLTAYYKMGNGFFDDKAKGVVHDQDDPGFGSELITNGDFSTSGSLTSTSYSLGFYDGGGDAGITISSGALNLFKENTDSNSGRAYVSNGSDGAISITDNKTYKVTYTIKENSASSTLQIWNGSSYNDVTSTVGTHVYYFVHNGSNLILKNKTTYESTIKISSFSLVELNGNPGLTSGGVTFSSNTP